ncbi:MAG: hypothetical protein ACOCTL_02355 [Candidatus Hadarchaeota archaeon]
MDTVIVGGGRVGEKYLKDYLELDTKFPSLKSMRKLFTSLERGWMSHSSFTETVQNVRS